MLRWIHEFPTRALIFFIELYRTWISPMRLPTCRFEPTCSAYAVSALHRHGFVAGLLLTVIRLIKCGPWHKPGYDPVPETIWRFPLLTGVSGRGSSGPSSHRRGGRELCNDQPRSGDRDAAYGSKG
ncbi:MAG: membrane protein insertion efficiency factor YidD [Gordonia sp. (in: high G+C Gram-positive bacteria)]